MTPWLAALPEFSMRRLVFFCFLLTTVLPLRSDPAPATAPSTTDDLSQYKTADELWDHIHALKDSFMQGSQNGDDSAKGLVLQMGTALDTFDARYPSDTRAWAAKLLRCHLDQVAVKMKLPGAPSPEDIRKRMEGIALDKNAPEDARAQASFELVLESFPEQIDAKFDFDALDAQVAAFQKEFGDFSVDGQQPAFFMLREQELQLLKLTGNDARYLALLKNLAADPNPGLADFAKHGIEQVEKIAELKTKPFELTYTAVDGAKVDVARMRGKVVLIDFWATWCGPCVEEMPKVVTAYQKFHDQGFEIVGVSLDQSKDALLAFTKKSGMTWPQYFDGQGFDNAISKSFDIYSIPTMWLIDKKGMLVSTEAGVDLESQVEKLLKSP